MNARLSTPVGGFSTGFNGVLWAWFGVVAVHALFSTPFMALTLWLQSSWTGITLPLCILFAAVAALVAWKFAPDLHRILSTVGEGLTAIPTVRWLTGVIVAGVMLRLCWVAIFPAVQISDMGSYSVLAQLLVEGKPYYTAETYANWPPGLPFVLAAHYLVFGVKPWVVPLLNMLLYSLAILAVHRLGKELGGESTARIATLLLMIWPNHIMMSALATKELLVIPVLTAALLAYVLCTRSHSARREAWLAVLSGWLTGIASLTQPSLMLLPTAFAAAQLARGEDARKFLIRIGFVTIGMIAAIAPWTIRNYVVLDAFVPISTAGGITFYWANNELATKGSITRTPKDLNQFDELTGNRMGFKWGLEWIAENPGKFFRVMLGKHIGFLGDESHGAYWGIKRQKNSSDATYIAMKGISNAYWMAIMLLSFAALVVHLRSQLRLSPDMTLLMLCLLYYFSIDSVFEAGSRHHTQLNGALAVLAALLACRGASHGLDRPMSGLTPRGL